MGIVDTGADNVSAEAEAPISIFAQNVSYSSPLSAASLPVLLFLAGLGITGFGAWQLSWGKKK